jgi:hypothetical protein
VASGLCLWWPTGSIPAAVYTLKYCKLKNAKPEFELLLPAD